MNTPDTKNTPGHTKQLCADLFLNNPLPPVNPPERVLNELMGAVNRTIVYSQPEKQVLLGLRSDSPAGLDVFDLAFRALALIVMAFIIVTWIMFSRHGIFI